MSLLINETEYTIPESLLAGIAQVFLRYVGLPLLDQRRVMSCSVAAERNRTQAK